jgi:hypothetical protein
MRPSGQRWRNFAGAGFGSWLRRRARPSYSRLFTTERCFGAARHKSTRSDFLERAELSELARAEVRNLLVFPVIPDVLTGLTLRRKPATLERQPAALSRATNSRSGTPDGVATDDNDQATLR